MKKLTKTEKKINSKIGKAIHDYDLIAEGDKILIAVSGGKDSLTLLNLLKERQSWAPVQFDLYAAHIITDFHCAACTHKSTLVDTFKGLDIEYRFKEIKVLDENGKTSCFWCSWNKRRALFEIADELGCNKIAMGHHKDDIAETMLMNLLYRGEISVMNPSQELFKGKLTIIRPLSYVKESMVSEFAKESNFPSKLCKCPHGKDSKRKYIKDFIKKTNESLNGLDVRTNIFKSITRIKDGYIELKEEELSDQDQGEQDKDRVVNSD